MKQNKIDGIENLKAFGEKLRSLRKSAGLSRERLLSQLDIIHHNSGTGTLTITPQLMWNWETAYTHKNRIWRPQWQHVIYLIEFFADYLTLQEATNWASQAGYRLTKTSLKEIFTANPDWPPNQAIQLSGHYVTREKLEKTIFNKIKYEQVETLVLWGAGGTGKTTLAARMAELLRPDFPDGVIWITVQPDDTTASILNSITESLGFTSDESSLTKQSRRLHSRLRKRNCLLILDDLADIPDLFHLRLGSQTSRLLCVSRDIKVADLFQAPLIHIGGLTDDEGCELLANRVDCNVKAMELVSRMGGLPLALILIKAQLRAGLDIDYLLSVFREKDIDLTILDMDDPSNRAESLSICFDVTYNNLPAINQKRFAWLGCFATNSFNQKAVAAIWGVEQGNAQKTLKQLLRFALIERTKQSYRLHPLLQNYARQKLSSQSADECNLRQRHASWYIRYALYHPGVLDNNCEPAPTLNKLWADVVEGVSWATKNIPQLASKAILLAHTERPALLEEVGRPLIKAVESYIKGTVNEVEQAILTEILADSCLLQGDFTAGLTHFENAGNIWQRVGNILANSRAKLRMAGVHLLRQERVEAAALGRQAQQLLQQCVPINADNLAEARTLFYWFNMIYSCLVRWEKLPEEDIISLAYLAEQTKQPILIARGLRIYGLYCLTPHVPRSPLIRQKGRELAIEAFFLWRTCGRKDQADDEVSFSKYNLTNCYSRRTAARFARRKSELTPRITLAQIRLIKNESLKWWLEATEKQRIGWLSYMLPRYLATTNRPCQQRTGRKLAILQPGSRAYCWVDDILNIGMLGGEGRRLIMDSNSNPPNHILNGPEWRVLSGQKILSLDESYAKQIVEDYVVSLES